MTTDENHDTAPLSASDRPAAGIAGLSRSVPFLVVVLASLAVYANTLLNGFVVDDLHQIVNNRQITDVRYLPEIFTTGVWEFEGRESSYYRPMMYVLYMAVYLILGPGAWGFHLLNVLLHAAASVLVLLIARRLVGEVGPAPGRPGAAPLLAALLFATHPIHTEAVAWPAGIADVSFALFYLLALWLYMIRPEIGRRTGLALSLLSFFLATLCKEPALTLPAAIVAFDLIVRREEMRWRPAMMRWSAYLVVAGAYFALRVRALSGFAPTTAELSFGPLDYVINVLALFARYLEKLVWPANLNFFHVYRPPGSLLSPAGIVSIAVAAGFAGAAWLAFRNSRRTLFGLTLIAVPLAPAFYLSALNQGLENAFTERYLYLPSCGLVLLAAVGIAWLQRTKPRWTGVAVAVVLAVAALYAAGTVRRNTVWRDAHTLWADTVRKSPDSAFAHQNYGYALLARGRERQGKEELRIAARMKPELVNAGINKGLAYGRKGLKKEAILQFHAALALDGDSPLAHYYLAVAYDDLGWLDQAIPHYERALELQPDSADAHNNLGVVYAKRGQFDRARSHFEAATRLRPENASYRANLRRAREKGAGGEIPLVRGAGREDASGDPDSTADPRE